MIIKATDIMKEEVVRLEREGDVMCHYTEKGMTHYGSRLEMLKRKIKRMDEK